MANELESRNYVSDSNPYSWSGWGAYGKYTISNTIRETELGYKDAFRQVKALAEKNGRPILVIYGKRMNKGTAAFNLECDGSIRSHNGVMGSLCSCQSGSVFEIKEPAQCGFYIVYYENDKDETCAEANEVKQFITQHGSISTGYPWYCVYCKYKDGHKFFRYGSLPSVNDVEPYGYDQIDPRKNLYNDFVNFATKRGQEVKFLW